MASALDARALKQRYSSKWRVAARRERLVLFLLNQYYRLPSMGFLAALTGLGSGSDSYVARGYASLEEAFDITVYRIADWKPTLFIDVTGVASPGEHKPGLGLCAGTWKLWKAEKYGVVERVWIAHVDDEGPRVRWIPLAVLASSGRKEKLLGDERPYLCLDSKKWKPTKALLKALQAQLIS